MVFWSLNYIVLNLEDVYDFDVFQLILTLVRNIKIRWFLMDLRNDFHKILSKFIKKLILLKLSNL